MNRITALALLPALLALSACDGDSDSTRSQPPPTRADFVAEFNPSEGILPFPSNLLFTGSTDGTLNIPVADPGNLADPRVALNALDGFSTIAPITTTFSDTLDPATVTAGTTIRVFEVSAINPFLNPGTDAPFTVTGVQGELTPGVDYTVNLSPLDPNQMTVVIVPLRPLKPKTHYLVVLTNGIRGVDGFAPLPDSTYILARGDRPLVDALGNSLFHNLSNAEAQTLEPIRRMVNSQEDAAATQGIDKNSIVLSWTFMTQAIEDVLTEVRNNTAFQGATILATGLDTADLGLGLPGIAAIHAGTLQVPYYLDSTAPLSGRWQASGGSEVTRYQPTPVATQAITIPVLVTVPNTRSGHSKPDSGWPVVIFQHGVTQNRTNLFAVADTLAAAGFVGIAIDLPLHGITETSHPFYTTVERTFDLDVVNNVTDAPGADGIIDNSGTHFINLASLLTSRDNFRQGVADLFHLTVALPALDMDGDAIADLDASRAHLVGHSLGGMVGGTFLGLEDRVAAATLAMVGGGIAKLLDASPSYGPLIEEGLEAKGVIKGTPEYEAFLTAAQTVVDSGDPINYAAAAAEAHPIHMIAVIGGAGLLPDQVIPNSVADAPLSGTEPLARIMPLTAIDATIQDPAGIRGIVRFTAGEHRSFLSPLPSPAATLEMQAEMASFMAADGTTLVITNPDVVQPVP